MEEFSTFMDIVGSKVTLINSGVYQQVEIATYGQMVFAKIGNNRFVRLHPDGRTSKSSIRWLNYDPGEHVLYTEKGKVLGATQDQYKAIGQDKPLLLAAPS